MYLNIFHKAIGSTMYVRTINREFKMTHLYIFGIRTRKLNFMLWGMGTITNYVSKFSVKLKLTPLPFPPPLPLPSVSTSKMFKDPSPLNFFLVGIFF